MTLAPLHFALPAGLWALLALPALALLHGWAERRATRRLARLIASPRLRAELTAAASAARRRGRYGLLLVSLAGFILAFARPQLGFEAEVAHRKGIDLLLMVDVSKSMLAQDIPPDRLTRARLAAQDLITRLQGDRVGLLAFAGSAFLQAPLTVDYDAVLTALNDLDVNTIPLGGTNLEAGINLALEAFGKAEANNRAIILMTDGETTAGEAQDALKAAARANDAGVRIFTVGLGTPGGSLIPTGEPGGFIKDQDGRIVRTKLDEPGLDRLAKAADGFYLHLQNGPTEMRSLLQDGLGRMKAGEINARVTRKPIERYQWPLGAALLTLAAAAFIKERRRARPPARAARAARATAAAVLLLLLLLGPTLARGAGEEPMSLYRQGRYDEAYKEFSELAKKHANERRLEFDAGASAYRGKKYEEAMDAFGRAMTSEDPQLQAQSHYNLGNTLFQHGLGAEASEAKVKEWRNAIQHYESAIKLSRQKGGEAVARDAAHNRDLVQKAIDEELKPKPTPPPKEDKKDEQKDDKKQPPKDNPEPTGKEPKPKDGQPGQGPAGPPKPGESGPEAKPSPSEGQPSPAPAPAPEGSPRPRGDVQSQPGEKKSPAPPGQSPGEPPPEPPEKKGEMSAAQARALLDSLKGEDDRPVLNERRKPTSDPSIKDW